MPLETNSGLRVVDDVVVPLLGIVNVIATGTAVPDVPAPASDGVCFSAEPPEQPLSNARPTRLASANRRKELDIMGTAFRRKWETREALTPTSPVLCASEYP
jgi:hypothetical protein